MASAACVPHDGRIRFRRGGAVLNGRAGIGRVAARLARTAAPAVNARRIGIRADWGIVPVEAVPTDTGLVQKFSEQEFTVPRGAGVMTRWCYRGWARGQTSASGCGRKFRRRAPER